MSHLTAEQAQRVKRLVPFIGPGLILAFAAGYANPAVFIPAFWAGTVWMIAMAVGAQVLVFGQHGTQARSAVVVRRPLEWISLGTAYSFVHWLYLIYANEYVLSSWWPAAPFDDWRGHWYRKFPYFARMALLLFFLVSLASFYAKVSRDQDDKPDPDRYARLRRGAWGMTGFTVILFAVACGDWVLGLDVAHTTLLLVPLVTIVVLATGMVAALSGTALFTAAVQRAKVIPEVSTIDDRKRLARWLMIATVVTAVATLGFALVAGDPWKQHWVGGQWMGATIAMAALAVIGLGLLAAGSLRSFAIGAGLTLLASFLSIYQLVMPFYSASVLPSWVVLGALTGAFSIVWLPVMINAGVRPLYPVNDPLITK